MPTTQYQRIATITLVVTTIALAGGILFFYLQLEEKKEELATLSAESQEQEQTLRQEIQSLEQRYTDTLEELELTEEERRELKNNLQKERERVDEIEDEYQKINSTVNDLLKLGNTDEELLQKYSRVYFLNENYIPSDLTFIDEKYLYGSKPLRIHKKVWPFLEDLLEDAEDDGMELRIVSAYRSFNYQGALKQRYTTIYGSGANAFSADQGYSEHQLGTTLDFTTPALGGTLSAFESTPEFTWLRKNAYKYGFVLSYPPNNSYYQYEPWHWRFVGKDLARELDDEEQYFYDLPQRELNNYLLNIFDR